MIRSEQSIFVQGYLLKKKINQEESVFFPTKCLTNFDHISGIMPTSL